MATNAESTRNTAENAYSRANTIKVDDSANIERALEESSCFEKNAGFGRPGDTKIGSQYVAPDAGIVVTVNCNYDRPSTVTAATIKETVNEEYSSVFKASEDDYEDAVSEYLDNVLTKSRDISGPRKSVKDYMVEGWADENFCAEVESWFEEAYAVVMADGGTSRMAGPMGPGTKGPEDYRTDGGDYTIPDPMGGYSGDKKETMSEVEHTHSDYEDGAPL